MTPRARLWRPLGGCLMAGVAILQASATMTPSLADGVDLVMDDSGAAIAELGMGFDLGPMQVLAEHKEYLAYLTRAGEDAPSDPMARRTTLSASALIGLTEGAGLPLTLQGEHQHYSSGDQDIDLSLESGLQLPGLQFAARLDMNQEFGADGASAQSWEGRLSLGFDWLGGSHEGSLDYDLVPTYQATEMAFSSFWPLADGVDAAFDLTHRPLDSLSEMAIGVNRRYGPFLLESDFSADNTGAFELGFSVSMSLAPEPAPPELRLSTLLSSLSNPARQSLVQDSFGILAITEGN